MLSCPNCGHENAESQQRCQNCRTVLKKHDTLIIPTLQERQRMAAAKQLKLPSTPTETASSLTLVVQKQGTPTEFALTPSIKRYLVGRGEDPSINVDVDLDPFQARELGVSRRHAVIFLKEVNWIVEDLDSKNGTYLNGERLEARTGYPLKEDDLVTFGRVIARVQFKA